MSCLAVNSNNLAVAKGLKIDYFDGKHHNLIDITPNKIQEDEKIVDIVFSSDCKYLAVITLFSKELIVLEIPKLSVFQNFVLPRSASKIRFNPSNSRILVADKSGDALEYDLKNKEDKGSQILGHLSFLLDILQTNNNKYIITSDRDEKIKVSCYPHTYNIQTYCLGHTEFVNHIELLPHDDSYLLSTSGDGFIKLWDFTTGKHFYTINTFKDVNNEKLREEFIKAMDEEGIQVNSLPIVNFAVTKLDEKSSLLAVTTHTFDNILLYSIASNSDGFSHKLQQTIQFDDVPSAIKFNGHQLYVYNEDDSLINVYDCKSFPNIVKDIDIKLFENVSWNSPSKSYHNSIRMLYKRKFDNVQEYQERKKQRLLLKSIK